MLIGPVLLLVVVPAIQSYFLGRQTSREPRLPREEAGQT
jgi:hypothetical protein